MRTAVVILLGVLWACGGAPGDRFVDGEPISPDVLAVLESLSPESLPPPPADVSNRFADDDRARALGQRFFFDTGFSGPLIDADNDGGPTTLGKKGETGRVACAGCHIPESQFSDTRTRGMQISLAAGWTERRTPSLLDIGHAKLLMWDGRRDALYNQPFGAVESALEMNSSRLYVAQQIYHRYKDAYEELFGPLPDFADEARFPPLAPEKAGCELGTRLCHGMPGDGAEFDGLSQEDQDAVTRVAVNFGKALGAYERQLTCGPSRFDAWMHGDATALTDIEQAGAVLFAGKGQCAGCHSGPFFSDQAFHVVGLTPAVVAVVFINLDDHGAIEGVATALTDPLNVRGPFSDGDDGRLPDDVTPAMDGAFRTPMLRCVSSRPSFFRTGQVRTLEDAVDFLVSQHGGAYLGTNEVVPTHLTTDEKAALVAFLRSLDGPGPAAELLQAP